MGIDSRKDPYLGFSFTVEIQNTPVGGFSDISGLAGEIEIETFREGGVNSYEHQLAGPVKFSSRLVLKRGYGDITYLWDWYCGVAEGKVERRDITILMAERSWQLSNACPVKWSGPEFHAATSSIAFESIELIHQGLTLNPKGIK